MKRSIKRTVIYGSSVSLLVLLLVTTVGAAELKGTVTARHDGKVKVDYVPDEKVAPAKGDTVTFSEIVPESEITLPNGTGTIKELGEGFVWVTVVTMNPRLQDIAIIEATGVAVVGNTSSSQKNIASTNSTTVTLTKPGLKRTLYYREMMDMHDELKKIARDADKLPADSPSRKILHGAFLEKKKARDTMKAQLMEFVGKTITLYGKIAQDDPLKAQAIASESMIQNASLAKGTIHVWVNDKHIWQIQGSPPDSAQLP